MKFWRSLGYVARRLGREFLILVLIVAALYVALDQYFLYRVRTLRAELVVVQEAMRPKLEPAWPGEGAAVALIPTVDREEFHGVFENGVFENKLAPPIMRVGMVLHKSRAYHREGPPTRTVDEAIADAEPDYARLRAVQREIRPAQLDDRPLDPEAARTVTQEHLGRPSLLVLYLTSLVPVQLAGDAWDRDQAMISLLLAGEALLLAQQPTTAWLTMDNEVKSIDHFLNATWYVLTENAIDDATAARLQTILVRLHRSLRLSPIRMGHANFWGTGPSTKYSRWAAEHLRFYRNYIDADRLQRDLDLAAAIRMSDKRERRQAYMPLFAQVRDDPTGTEGRYTKQILADTKQREFWSLQCAVLVLMLQLEQHRIREGVYPEAITDWAIWSPAGLLPNSFEYADTEYHPDVDRLGYRLTLRGPGYFLRNGSGVDNPLPYVRRYQEHPFE